MIMYVVPRLDAWFSEQLSDLQCADDTRAYVVGVFSKNNLVNDMSNESIILAYSNARATGDFVAYQRIGDWVICTETFWPSNNSACVETIGRLSYDACHRMLKQWHIYEELADELPYIVKRVRSTFEKRGLVIL